MAIFSDCTKVLGTPAKSSLLMQHSSFTASHAFRFYNNTCVPSLSMQSSKLTPHHPLQLHKILAIPISSLLVQYSSFMHCHPLQLYKATPNSPPPPTPSFLIVHSLSIHPLYLPPPPPHTHISNSTFSVCPSSPFTTTPFTMVFSLSIHPRPPPPPTPHFQ